MMDVSVGAAGASLLARVSLARGVSITSQGWRLVRAPWLQSATVAKTSSEVSLSKLAKTGLPPAAGKQADVGAV